MKTKCVILAAALVLVLCLIGCSSNKNPDVTTTPSHSNTPNVSQSVRPDTNTNNDAMQGGGAGGVNDPETTPSNNGILDDIGDAAGDIADDIGDALNNNGNSTTRMK